MNRFNQCLKELGFVICGLALVVGCGKSDSDISLDLPIDNESIESTSVQVAPMVLDAKPEGDAKTPTDLKESNAEGESVVLAGRIDAGDMDPFQQGRIAFMVSELPEEGHADDDPDHADNCPFCKRRLENAPKAIVQFVGDDGQSLAGNARAELGLEQGDIVYVTGFATYNAAVDTVMVDATGVYRREDK